MRLIACYMTAFLVGCAEAVKPAANALTAAEYDRALDVCVQLAARESTKETAGEAFDTCAADINRRWCETRGLRCGGK